MVSPWKLLNKSLQKEFTSKCWHQDSHLSHPVSPCPPAGGDSIAFTIGAAASQGPPLQVLQTLVRQLYPGEDVEFTIELGMLEAIEHRDAVTGVTFLGMVTTCNYMEFNPDLPHIQWNHTPRISGRERDGMTLFSDHLNWLVLWDISYFFQILGISSSQLTNSYFSEG